MYFHIVHTTEYEYSEPAVESYTELRVRPRNTLKQVVQRHYTLVEPRVPMESYDDYYGNFVEFLSVPFRHRKLVVTSRSAVETRAMPDPLTGLDLYVSEAVRLAWPYRRELYDFLMPSEHARFHPGVREIAGDLFTPGGSYVDAVQALNALFTREFKYQPGVTDVRTPIEDVISSRQGVCQDFAHIMIAVLRCAGLPARYVSGYIETDAAATQSEAQLQSGAVVDLEEADADDKPLVGATASHAWVELFTPNGQWVGLDPTNNILEGERHVQIAIGRDYADVPPLRGVFKGAQRQLLSVHVSVRRSRTETGQAESGNGNATPNAEAVSY